MQYESYKKLKEAFRIVAQQGYRPKAILVLNNKRKIRGFLLDVNSNHITFLKIDGRVSRYPYTRVYEVRIVGEAARLIRKLNNLNNNESYRRD